MSASIEHPARVLFSGGGVSGLIIQLVTRSLEERREVPGAEGIAQRFTDARLLETAEFVRFLAGPGQEVQKIATGSIDLEGVALGPFSFDAAQRLQSLVIGHGQLTPIMWFGHVSNYVAEIPEQTKAAMEAVMSGLHRMMRQVSLK